MNILSRATNHKSLYQIDQNAPVSFSGIVGIDTWIFFNILMVTNIHLISVNFYSPFIFSSAAWLTGQWWRLFTYPFVHVSLYHLLLDGAAFLLLYQGLEEQNPSIKVFYIISCGVISLGVAITISPFFF